VPHKIMPHFRDGRFSNHPDEKRESIFLRSLFMYCAGWRVRNSGLLELAQWHEPVKEVAESLQAARAQPSVTWIGHASFLVQLPGYNILTDPVFKDLTLLFQRIQQPGISREDLPRIDAVIISHNHRDHMEQETLQYLAKKFPECQFFVPKGDLVWLRKWGIDRGVELSWWEESMLQRPGAEAGVRLVFLPAYHWSQRGVFDMNRSLWGSWMIEHGATRIYFAGDTAYSGHFQSVAKEFSDITCTLMPIGPCEPNHWMKKSHINAEEAGRAFLELGAQSMIPMHWGTYKFGMDNPMLPMQRLQAWWEREGTNSDRTLIPLKIGGSKILI